MKTKLLLTILFLGGLVIAQAQGLKLGDNPLIIDAASLLEMESTSLVFVPSRVTTAQMNAITPLDGALVYNTTEEALFYYDNGAWSAVGAGSHDFDTNNVFVGSAAGESNTSGANNNAFGANALSSNTVADNNNAFGFSALEENIIGERNTAMGHFALNSNNSSNNTAVGFRSLEDHVGGLRNSAFGAIAMRRLASGNNNIAIGNNAGNQIADNSFLTDSDNSIYLGNGARASANGEINQIVIGHLAAGNGSNTVTLGNDAITETFLQGTVNAADIDITGTLTVGGEPITPGGGGGTDPNVGTNNVFVGNGAGVNTALDATGRENVAMGVAALGSNVTGIRNTAVGTEALFSNVSSEGNTAVGNSALVSSTGSSNTGVGFASLKSSTSGARNSALGSSALENINSGSDNTGIGNNAGTRTSDGALLTSSSFSVFLGSSTRANANGESNQVVIGHGATGNGTQTVTIGNASITDNYFTGRVHANSFKLKALQSPPASSSAPGETGEIRIDANFIYVCVASNSWVRAALSSW